LMTVAAVAALADVASQPASASATIDDRILLALP
jgi:hypothetical protein